MKAQNKNTTIPPPRRSRWQVGAEVSNTEMSCNKTTVTGCTQVPHCTRVGLRDFTWASPTHRKPRSGTAAYPEEAVVLRFSRDLPKAVLPAPLYNPLLLPAVLCILENPPVK